jgi:hypothetical protein
MTRQSSQLLFHPAVLTAEASGIFSPVSHDDVLCIGKPTAAHDNATFCNHCDQRFVSCGAHFLRLRSALRHQLLVLALLLLD